MLVSDEKSIDEGLKEALSHNKGRARYSGKKTYLQECTAVSDRHHDEICFMAKAIINISGTPEMCRGRPNSFQAMDELEETYVLNLLNTFVVAFKQSEWYKVTFQKVTP